jgi:hypothetical protein
MTSEEYIQKQISVGAEIHFNEGVWWSKIAPFFYKPANPFQVVESGKSRPKMRKALLGYSHIVNDKKAANRYWSVLQMNQERLKKFEMKSLSSSKRAQVRKGLKLTEIKAIENIETVIEDIKNICVSAALRTQHGKPPEYYTTHYNEWKSWIIKLFKLSGGEWLGSFYNGALIAYYYTVQIEDTMIIQAAKSHTDFLDRCPNDALLYVFLSNCRNLNDCSTVIFGDWSNDAPSLNIFKQKYGFEKTDLPGYVKYNPLVYAIKKVSTILNNRRLDDSRKEYSCQSLQK